MLSQRLRISDEKTWPSSLQTSSGGWGTTRRARGHLLPPPLGWNLPHLPSSSGKKCSYHSFTGIPRYWHVLWPPVSMNH